VVFRVRVHNILNLYFTMFVTNGGRQWRWSQSGMASNIWRSNMCGRRCSREERHLLDDDTKVYPIKVVHKPSLGVFYYLKRERVSFR
jgi:hypothetical protein